MESYRILSGMLADLKLGKQYDGMLYLADARRNLQRIQSHHHVELELNLVVQGAITYVLNGRRFTFSARTLLWLFPQQEHQLVARTDDARFYVAAFKPSLIRRSCHLAAYQGLKLKPREEDSILSTALDPKAFELVCRVMDSLMQGSLDSDVLNREAGFCPASSFRFEHHHPDALNAGMRYLLLLCWDCQQKGNSTHGAVALHPAVHRSLNLLSEDDTGQDLAGLAKACGVSKSYLSRIFHRQIGVALNEYRNTLRLARFFEEYRQPQKKTIADAVYAAGFGSYAQFYKVFSQAYGCGPRECLVPHGSHGGRGKSARR
ncbi:MAG: helix-turn-helix domain-containing protein [Terracidiphilus sp.]